MDLGELAVQLLRPHGSRPIPGTKETRGPSLQDVIGFGGVGSNESRPGEQPGLTGTRPPRAGVSGNSAETLSHFPARRGDEGRSPPDSALCGIKMGSRAGAAGAPGPGQLSCPAPRSGHSAKQGAAAGQVSQACQSRRLAEACSVPSLGSALCSEGACGLAPVETACQLDLARTGLAASEDGATAGGGSEAPSSVALRTPGAEALGDAPLVCPVGSLPLGPVALSRAVSYP